MVVTNVIFLIFLALAGARNIPAINEELQHITAVVLEGEFSKGLVDSAARVQDLQLLEEMTPVIRSNVFNTARDAKVKHENAVTLDLQINIAMDRASRSKDKLQNIPIVFVTSGANVNENGRKPVNGDDDRVHTRPEAEEFGDKTVFNLGCAADTGKVGQMCIPTFKQRK